MMFEGKRIRLAVIGFLTFWVLGFLGAVVCLSGAIYVIVHFIQKFW